jgi:hypothetical protein
MDSKSNEKREDLLNMDCSDTISIPVILDAMKEINKYSSKIYYHGEIVEYSFIINSGCSLSNLNDLENLLSYKLPDDYRELMSSSNGLSLTSYAKILNTEEIYRTRSIYGFYPENMLIVADCYNSEVQILIDMAAKCENCMYVIDAIADDFFYSLNCNFTMFLNRFILAYGSDFWNWNKTQSSILKIT